MADAKDGTQLINKSADMRKETETPASRGKAAIPLDYSVGGDGVDVNMEAPIFSEDLIRAGGLGAGDGVSSAMPTTVDATDYEESLMDAAEYEDKEGVEPSRRLHPGLGLKD